MTNDGTSDYIRQCAVRWGKLAEALGARGIALLSDGDFVYARRASRIGFRASVSVYLHAPSLNDWGRGRPDFEIEVMPMHGRRQTFKQGMGGFNWEKIVGKIERSLRISEARYAEAATALERHKAAGTALRAAAKELGLKPPISIWSTRVGGVVEATDDGAIEFSFHCPVEHITDVLGLLKRLGIAKRRGAR